MRKQANDNSYLFQRELEVINEVVARQPDLDLTFSRVFPMVLMSNPEAEVHKYRVADDDSGSAQLLRKMDTYPRIKVSGSELSTDIYKIGVKFEIPLEDVKNSRAWQRPLDTEHVERSKRAVDEKMNKVAYLGDSIFGVPGALTLSGVTSFTGSDLDTANLNLADEVTKAVNAIPVRFRRRPYSLVLADAEYKKFQNIGNTFSNETWLTIAQRQHPNLSFEVEADLDAGGSLSDDTTLAAATGLLIPKDQNLVRIPVGIMPEAIFKPNQSVEYDEMVSAKVKARMGTVEAPFPTSIVKITWDN